MTVKGLQELELPFDAGISRGLRVYTKRALYWAAIMLCNLAALSIFYAAARYPSVAFTCVAFGLVVGLIVCLLLIAGFKIALALSPAIVRFVKVGSTPPQVVPPVEEANAPDRDARAGRTLIPIRLGLRRAIVPVLAAASCLLGAVVTTRVLEHRSELLTEQMNALRKDASVTRQEVASLQRRLADAETAAKDYNEQPRVTITNNTPFPISINVKPTESGTQLKLDLQPGDARHVRVLPGSYRLVAFPHGASTVGDETTQARVFARGAEYSVTYTVNTFALGKFTVNNLTESPVTLTFGSGRTAVVPSGRMTLQVPFGSYSIGVSTRCGTTKESVTISATQTAEATYKCVVR
jgi:hypothetical protein